MNCFGLSHEIFNLNGRILRRNGDLLNAARVRYHLLGDGFIFSGNWRSDHLRRGCQSPAGGRYRCSGLFDETPNFASWTAAIAAALCICIGSTLIAAGMRWRPQTSICGGVNNIALSLQLTRISPLPHEMRGAGLYRFSYS